MIFIIFYQWHVEKNDKKWWKIVDYLTNHMSNDIYKAIYQFFTKSIRDNYKIYILFIIIIATNLTSCGLFKMSQ
jgi:hypothetical protein